MNRKDRRKLERIAKEKGVKASLAEALATYMGIKEEKPKIFGGDKVMIDVDKIMSRTDFNRAIQNYKDFVESARGIEFEAVIRSKGLIGLVGEEWLFLESDVIKV